MMHASRRSPIVLSIAGYDPSSGAGVTADIKTAAAHGCFALTCITALTVQSTKGVKSVQPVSGELVRRTCEELASDMPIAAVRIGMLGSAEVAEAVAQFLEGLSCRSVVLDPITRASSGSALLDPGGVEVLKNRLLPLSTIVTPNVNEAGELTGIVVTGAKEQRAAAERLLAKGAKAAVVTGGHLPEAVDLLLWRSGDGNVGEQIFRAEKIESQSTHGTGCAFATAITCNLALGQSIPDSVGSAKDFVRKAILEAEPIGTGIGPLRLI